MKYYFYSIGAWIVLGSLSALFTPRALAGEKLSPTKSKVQGEKKEQAQEKNLEEKNLSGKNQDESQIKLAKKNALEAKKNAISSAEYHFSLAQAYSSDGNPDRAIEEYKLTLMFDPNSALVYTRLASEFIKKGMLTSSMEACKEAVRLDTKYIDARLILAGLYSAAHESPLALAEYDRILKLDPKNEEAAVYKAQVLIEDNLITQAGAVLRQFTQKNSESVLAFFYLGRVEQQLGHFKPAITAYKKALTIRPSFNQAALALGYLYEERSDVSGAISVYKALFDDFQDAAAASRLATLYLKQERYKESVPYLEALQVLDPEDMNVRVKLGLVQMELKNFEQAVAIFKGILEKNPDSDRIHYYLGSLYEEQKMTDAAIGELKAIKPESKLFPDAALHVGYLYKQTHRIPEAKEYIQSVISTVSKTSSFYLFQASLEEETKSFPEAIQILIKATKEFPEDEKIRYYLGSLYDREGNIDRSLEQMEAILKINPENVDALNYIGYTWTQKGIHLNDAEKLLKRALGLRPDNGYIQDSWGWYLLTRGRVTEAVIELEKAAKLKPNESIILEHLGDAYLRSNLRKKALRQYSDAAKFADDEAAKKKVLIKAENLKKEMDDSDPLDSNIPTRLPATTGSK